MSLRITCKNDRNDLHQVLIGDGVKDLPTLGHCRELALAYVHDGSLDQMRTPEREEQVNIAVVVDAVKLVETGLAAL